jgi:hypothetical protein
LRPGLVGSWLQELLEVLLLESADFGSSYSPAR